MERQPVSGILPIRNGANWISSNLPNILECLGDQDELIIVNDGSDDQTQAMLMSFQKRQSNIKVINQSATGLVESLNLAIKCSQNEWIARFDIDDRYVTTRLDSQFKYANHSSIAVFSDYSFYGNGLHYLGSLHSPIFNMATRVSLLRSQRTAHPSVIFRKSAVISQGGYVPTDFPAEDLGLWLRLGNIGNISSCPEGLLLYNLRKGSVSQTRREIISDRRNELLQKYFRKSWVVEAAENFEETMYLYQIYSECSSRQMLHLYDLLHPLSRSWLGGQKLKGIISTFFAVSHFYSALNSLSVLGRQKCKRTIFRKIN